MVKGILYKIGVHRPSQASSESLAPTARPNLTSSPSWLEIAKQKTKHNSEVGIQETRT